ncbi:MAG: hypothetical protein R3F19_34410 [Verrucomicrobiales bacterium]
MPGSVQCSGALPDIEPDALTVAQQRALAECVVNSGILVLPTETVDSWRESIFTDAGGYPSSKTTTTDLFPVWKWQGVCAQDASGRQS